MWNRLSIVHPHQIPITMCKKKIWVQEENLNSTSKFVENYKLGCDFFSLNKYAEEQLGTDVLGWHLLHVFFCLGGFVASLRLQMCKCANILSRLFFVSPQSASQIVVCRLVMYRTKVLMYHTMVLLARLIKVRC